VFSVFSGIRSGFNRFPIPRLPYVHFYVERIFVGLGRIHIFGSPVIIEHHIITSGAVTIRKMFSVITSESKIGILPKTNKFSFNVMLKMNLNSLHDIIPRWEPHTIQPTNH